MVPTGPGVGLTSVALGLVRALERRGLRVGFHKPIRQPGSGVGPEPSTAFARHITSGPRVEPLAYHEVEALLATDRRSLLLQRLVGDHEVVAAGADVVIVEGLTPTAEHAALDTLNEAMARAFDADVILVATVDGSLKSFSDRVELTAEPFGGVGEARVLGVIVNKLNSPSGEVMGISRTELKPPEQTLDAAALSAGAGVLSKTGFDLIGAIPFDAAMLAPRTLDVAQHLRAKVLLEGELATRRVIDVSLVARTVANMTHRLKPGALIVTPGDRDDVILAACMAALSDVPLAGLVLTGDILPNGDIMRLCAKALNTGLPVLSVETDSYVTAARCANMSYELPLDDAERVEHVTSTVASALEVDGLIQRLGVREERRLSPPAFLYQLVEKARGAGKRIVLPEGTEPRTVRAASLCAERGIATCVLLGDPAEALRVAAAQGVELGPGVELVEPTDAFRERYVSDMVKLRSHKGLTEDGARNLLKDDVVLGTMMLALGDVDGLVAGAIHTTAHTVRPALQLIKTKPDAKLVSSVFFMCLPEQVLVYGDCAVNPDPNAEELADIAIQSAESAGAFGIQPRVALISYSTGSSGEGADVEKVRLATEIAKERRPDLLIDGPLQYDAATVPSVAQSKSPGSPVAGRATVLVFPDLNTGNATYKAVQRAADVVSVGPMLQGLRRPVNDLSRGALVDDIVYTIALTAIQADG